VSGSSRGELYVYYLVARASWPAALQCVLDFQQRLRDQHPGLAARVLRRSGERADAVTLMEIYAFDDGIHGGIDPALRSRIEEAAAVLTPMLSGSRITEVFEALD
jgi:hypothetical protein